MAQLLQISNYQIIALKDEVDITPEMRHRALNQTTGDFSSDMVDVPTSLYLLAMLNKSHLIQRDFLNQADKLYPKIATDEKYTYIYPQYSLDSRTIPEMLKLTGLQILRNMKVAYVTDDKGNPDKYALTDTNGKPFENESNQTRARVTNKIITIIDNVAAISHNDYAKILSAQHKIDNKTPISQLPEKDVYGWALARTFQDALKTDKYIFIHELKHIKNEALFNDAIMSQRDITLSAMDFYKIAIDNEISAKLAEVFKAIEIFQRKSNPTDISMFGAVPWMLSYMKNIPAQSRYAASMNLREIVSKTCEYWNKVFLDAYNPQFMFNTDVHLNQLALDNISDTPNDANYAHIRSLFYNFSIYNPATGNYINMDLSDYVPSPHLSQAQKLQLTQMQTDIVSQRRDLIAKYDTRIDHSLLDAALAMQRNALAQSAYMQQLNELRAKGYNAGAALDLCMGMNIVAKDMEILGIRAQNQTAESEHNKNIQPAPQNNTAPAKEAHSFWTRAMSKIKDKSNKITIRLFAKNKQDETNLL